MARKPNYKFERHERDRAKAAKLAEKARARQAAAAPDAARDPGQESAETPAAEPKA